MKRLTRKSSSTDMVWFVDHDNNDMDLEPCEMSYAHNKLAIEKLAEYEDLKEQGRLMILPCKIGDTVYRVCKKKYDVDGYGMQWEEDWGIVTNAFHLGMFNEIGKNVFLTRAEAEEVLRSK